MYSIVIPYPSNSKCINTCLEYLYKNSTHEFEFVPIVDEKDVYYAFNKGVYKAKYDTVVLMNDDMMVCRNWDKLIPEYSNETTILTGYVLEPNPGPMMYGPQCYKLDCGDSPTNFDYDKFQTAIDNNPPPLVVENSLGWYMPVVFNQKTFVSYPNIGKFPYVANDVTLFATILPNLGFKFTQINMCVYHFQRASTKLNYPDFK